MTVKSKIIKLGVMVAFTCKIIHSATHVTSCKQCIRKKRKSSTKDTDLKILKTVTLTVKSKRIM